MSENQANTISVLYHDFLWHVWANRANLRVPKPMGLHRSVGNVLVLYPHIYNLHIQVNIPLFLYIYIPLTLVTLYISSMIWFGGVFNVNCGKGLIIPWISPPSPILPMISPYDWWYPHWNLKPIKLWWLLNYIMLDDVLIIIISPWYTNKDHHIYIYICIYT